MGPSYSRVVEKLKKINEESVLKFSKLNPFIYARKTTKNLFPEKSGDDPEPADENFEDFHENDVEFWRANDEKIEARLAARKKRLENYCKNIYPAELDHSMHDWQHKTRHFYVGDGPHKFLGCVPLKVYKIYKSGYELRQEKYTFVPTAAIVQSRFKITHRIKLI